VKQVTVGEGYGVGSPVLLLKKRMDRIASTVSGVRIPSGAPVNKINDLKANLAAIAAVISGSLPGQDSVNIDRTSHHAALVFLSAKSRLFSMIVGFCPPAYK
jgi:hypothetical protein